MDAKQRMEILAFSYMKSDKVFQFIANNKSMRGCMVWGSSMEGLKLSSLPFETKMDFWNESGKYGLDQKQRIEYCQALHYLSFISSKV